MNEVLASQSAASRLLSNVTVARAAFVKPNGTCTPLPNAIWLPAENVATPVAIVAFVMSNVTVARAAFVKPNGTCTPLPNAIWLPAENVATPVAIVAFVMSNVTVARAAFVKPNGTCTPLPNAIWLPAENVATPVAIVAFVMSTVTPTSRDSPGFSVNDAGFTVTFCPVFVGTVADRIAAAVPRFVRRTVFVADHDACDGRSRPYDTTGGSAKTPPE